LGESSYGFGWSVSPKGFGHGGAYKNAMEINPSTGRILIFMVQQQGDWGTKEGNTMVSTLQRLADDAVTAHAAVSPVSKLVP
jgi:CubicO group peptidase (beta-lactamase class C family)